MRIAYADPPYPGNAELYRDHPDYAGEVDHAELIDGLTTYDGWGLSTSAAALRDILPMCPPDVRVLAWVKNTITVAWEPLIVKPARPVKGVRDWIHVEPDSYQWRPKPDTYVIGQKPEPFCVWMFQWIGADPAADDEFQDLFPGSGSVYRSWLRWTEQPALPYVASDREHRRNRSRLLAQHPTLPEDAEVVRAGGAT